MDNQQIGRRKYDMLKSLANTLSDEEREQVESYESNNKINYEPTEKASKYFKKLQEEKRGVFKVDYDRLLEKYLEKFEIIEGVEFNKSYLPDLETILFYFAEDDRFFNCKNLSNKSRPSFKKGLLVVGDYGNGKSSTFRVLKSIFNGSPLTFKSYTTNKMVSVFESYKEVEERASYMSRTKTKTAYFDDVKTEKIASNYGLHNLMKEVIEERYNNKMLTFITCNYVEGDNTKNLDMALKEFGDKYGARVYDRLFEMFNIIEFNGKSLRV